MRYDHYNYARWGPVYLTEMHQLPTPVLSEFEKGNFVVKRSTRKFNQVDPDQAQEWLKGVGKKGGGIVGIMKTASALCRWTLSYNLRSHIAMETYAMYQMRPGEKLLHNESTNSRQERDTFMKMHWSVRSIDSVCSLQGYIVARCKILQPKSLQRKLYRDHY